MEEGAQDGEYEHRAVPHVAVRSPLPVRAPPRPVRSLGHIGRVLARRARSTRCPVSRDVRRAELLKAFSAFSDPAPTPVNGGLETPRRGRRGAFTSSRTHGAFRRFRNAPMVGSRWIVAQEREKNAIFSLYICYNKRT